MQMLPKQLLLKLKDIREQKGSRFELEDIDIIIREIMHEISHFVTEQESYIFHEMKAIETDICALKEGAKDISDNSVEQAKLELSAVVESTEKATNDILDSAEIMQKDLEHIHDPALKERISEQLTQIIMACHFQDLTGQRLNKVVNTLILIEERVGKILCQFGRREERKEKTDEQLMNGPQLANDAPTQEDIDRLFDEA